MIFDRINLEARDVLDIARPLISDARAKVCVTAVFGRHAGSNWHFVAGRLALLNIDIADEEEIYTEHGFVSKGEFIIELNETRGQIQISSGHASILGQHEPLCIVGNVNHGESITLTGTECVPFDPAQIMAVNLWLLTKNDEVIDYLSSDDGPHRYRTAKQERDYETLLREMIANGENDMCEFKEYINLTDTKDSKAIEIDETVCAFSNLKGGKLFIGVTNKTVVVGVANQVRHAYRLSTTESIEAYIAALKLRLRDNLKDASCFSVEHRYIFAEPVIVVSVEKAKGINYLINPCEAYIRAGGNSKKMPFDKIEDHIRRENSTPSFLNNSWDSFGSTDNS